MYKESPSSKIKLSITAPARLNKHSFRSQLILLAHARSTHRIPSLLLPINLDSLLKPPRTNLLREQIINLLSISRNNQESLHRKKEWDYLSICQTFGFGTIEIQKNCDDNAESEEHVADLSTEIAGVGVDYIGDGEDDDPPASSLGDSDNRLGLRT
jgi:hypothetical protein